MIQKQWLKFIEHKLEKENLPIVVRLWDGITVVGNHYSEIELQINSPKAFNLFMNPNLSTIAESYVHQEIDFSGDIRNIIQVLSSAFNKSTSSNWMNKITNFAHSRDSDKEAISHHYDVSNDFYALWLDKNRVYSCAYYNSLDDSLDLAQEQKLDHICKKLNLKNGEALLDIGCGWGALIFWAAERYGVKSTGITLSQKQYSYVKQEIERRGLQNTVKVRLQDYRDIPEDEFYDKIVSVGMFEHVGNDFLPMYFRTIYNHLKPGGVVLNHGITTSNLEGGYSSSGGEFIDKYVFPNGELSHISRVLEVMSREGLEVLDNESLRRHYAQTLWSWVDNLERNREKALEFVGETNYRIWRSYMGGSAYAFEQNWINLYQILAAKPENGSIDYPLTRQHIYR